MGKRSKTGQSKHDNSVLRSARWYESDGYNVKADLPKYDKPKKIGGFVPDIQARKGKKEVIVEVESKATNKSDADQQQAFREYASRKSTRNFKKKVI